MGFKFSITDTDKGWNNLKLEMGKAAKAKMYAAVGYIEGVNDGDHDGLSNVALASIHEFGTEDGHIPERSFIRSTFDEQLEKLTALSARMATAMLDGKISIETALGRLGARLAADIKNKVSRGSDLRANAPATVRAKGSNRPLVDTGRLIGALTWVIRKAG